MCKILIVKRKKNDIKKETKIIEIEEKFEILFNKLVDCIATVKNIKQEQIKVLKIDNLSYIVPVDSLIKLDSLVSTIHKSDDFEITKNCNKTLKDIAQIALDYNEKEAHKMFQEEAIKNKKTENEQFVYFNELINKYLFAKDSLDLLNRLGFHHGKI